MDMKNNAKNRIDRLLRKIPLLSEGQLIWLDRVIQIFESPNEYLCFKSDLFDGVDINNFGDALRIHHSFSVEPFSKDKFEYVLEKVLNMRKKRAHLAPKGNRGYDIIIDDMPVSLKTQANRDIKDDKIWISKFMELGKGQWTDKPEDFMSLRKAYFNHLNEYDRILILRALTRSPEWYYELVEIPMKLMRLAQNGELEIKVDSKQFPKPGYYHVYSENMDKLYDLYFDAGSERKLQIKNLVKSHCIVHATWRFTIPREEE